MISIISTSYQNIDIYGYGKKSNINITNRYLNHKSNGMIHSPYLFTLYTCKNERMKETMKTIEDLKTKTDMI